MLKFPLLSVIIFWPIFGSFVVLAVYRRPNQVRWLSLIVTLVELGLVAALFFLNLQPHATSEGVWLLLEDYLWIPWLGARYTLGLDGISLLLLVLIAFLNVLCVLCSWRAIDFKQGSFYFFLLFLEGTLAGLFLAALRQFCGFGGLPASRPGTLAQPGRDPGGPGPGGLALFP